MSLLWILGSWTVFLLGALYYLGLLGGPTVVVKESTSTKDSTKPADSEITAKAKKKYAKKKRKKKKKQEKKQNMAVNKEQAGDIQEEKPDSVPETKERKERSQTPKIPVKPPMQSTVNELKTIPYKTNETKTTPHHIKESKPIPICTPIQYVAPNDVTPFIPPHTSNEYSQNVPNFQTGLAAAPMGNEALAPAPSVNDALAPAPALLTNTAPQIPATLKQEVESAEEPMEIDEVEDEDEVEDDEAPIEELGGDWFAYRSTEYGLPYYHNVRTLETVWDRPVVEPQVEPYSASGELEEPDFSQMGSTLQQDSPPLQERAPAVLQQAPLVQQQTPYMSQPNSFSPQQRTGARLTFAEKLRLAKQRSPVAVPKLLIKTNQKKAQVSAVPPPEYSPMPISQNIDISSWATVSSTTATPKKLITTSSWVKVGSNVTPEPVKKKGPPKLTEQLQAFKTALMQARTAKKWKQSELAKRLDIRPQELSKYEQGKDVPAPALINRMTRVLGVKLPRVKKSKMKETQPLPDD